MKLFVIFLLTLVTGCTLAPRAQAPVSVYDFGSFSNTASHSSIFPEAIIQVAEIDAPVWLDTQAIRYRLSYHDPARTYVYANSHWVAPPAKLLTERLRQYISTHTHWQNKDKNSGDRPPANYLLKIALEEFIQVFDTQDDSSQITIRLRADLYETNTRQPIAQQNFLDERVTPTADAAGAVSTFILASDSLSNELIQWLSDTVR